MDDKYNRVEAGDEWCVYNFGISFNDMQAILAVEVIDKLYRMDVEIDELKRRINELESR
jgi:predicted ATP-grasp superfamily ATP-dependent carboligase